VRTFEAARHITFGVKVAILVIIAMIVVALVGVFGFGWFQRTTADYRGKTEQIEQIQGDGSYRIAAYDNFYNLCAAVQSAEVSIDNVQRELDASPDAQRKVVLRATLTALKNNRASLIAQYNADARKEDTAGAFRASDLPYQIDMKGDTTCTA
jgi:hypothetical protein